MSRVASWVVLTLLLTVGTTRSVSAQEEHPFVIPPGREEAILEWLAPLEAGGFAGRTTSSTSIHGEEIRVLFQDVGGAPVEGCRPPDWARGADGLTLRRIRPVRAIEVRGDQRRGQLDRGWLRLSWFLCHDDGSDPARASREARRIAEALVAQDPDAIWRPPRTHRAVDRLEWLLAVGVVLAIAGVSLARRRRLALALLAISTVPLALGFASAWEERAMALLWLGLGPPLVVAMVVMAKRGRTTVATFAVPAVGSLITRVLAEKGPSNWYVDLAGVPGAVQEPFSRVEGGLTSWPSLAAPLLAIGPEHVFALSVVSSSLGVGFLVSALGRAIERDGVWPKGTHFLWAGLLAVDSALIWLGASDAPHNVAMLAFGLALWWTVETSREGQARAAELLALGLCSALVGLTRPELVVAPAICPLILGLGGSARRARLFLLPSTAALLGVAVAAVVAISRGALRVVSEGVRGLSLDTFHHGLTTQAPWSVELEPLLVGAIPSILVLAFSIACAKRPWLALTFIGYLIAVMPKVVGGFGGAVIGKLEPSQRYNIVIIPAGLLIVAGGVAALGALLLPWLRGERGRARRGLAVMVGVLAILWIADGFVRSVGSSPEPSYRAEYRFLGEHLDRIPRGESVATVWLEHLTERDLDAQLALPHALLSLVRPDLHWVVMGPGDDLARARARYFYRGATCSLDRGRGPLTGTEGSGDRELVRQSIELCASLDSRVERWIAEEEEVAAAGTWPMRDGRVRLGLGRLRD